ARHVPVADSPALPPRVLDRLLGAGVRVPPARHRSLPERRPDRDAGRRHGPAAAASRASRRGSVRPASLAPDGVLPDPARAAAHHLATALVDPGLLRG